MTTPRKVLSRFRLEAMSNLRSKVTGVENTIIWVSSGEFSGSNIQHGPKIKVALGNKITDETLANAISIQLTDPPQVLGTLPGEIKKQAVEFVSKNRDTLLHYWNKEIDTAEMLERLEKA